MNLAEDLLRGCEQLEIELSAEAQQKLLGYVSMLHKWNKVYNLTAIRDPQQMIINHLLDCLAVLPYLWGVRWLDVGSGAGLPGVVLAITQPNWQLTLLDSNSKKTSFLQQVIIELDLNNTVVNCARLEDWRNEEKFDGIISRAFTGLGDFIARTRHLLNDDGKWAAMKGIAELELSGLPAGCAVERIVALQVPGLRAARSLVIATCKENGTK